MMKINRYLWYFLYIIPGPLLGIVFFIGCLMLIGRVVPGLLRMAGNNPAVQLVSLVLLIAGALGSIALVRNVLFEHLFVPVCPSCCGRLNLTRPRSVSFRCNTCGWNNE